MRPSFEFSSMDYPESTSIAEDEDRFDALALPEPGSWSSIQPEWRSGSPDVGADGLGDGSPYLQRDNGARFQHQTPPDVFDARGLPCLIRLSPPRTSSAVFGTLFERRDPWKTVGQILGVEPSSDQDNGVEEIESEPEISSLCAAKGSNMEGSAGHVGIQSSRAHSSEWSRSMLEQGTQNGSDFDHDEGESSAESNIGAIDDQEFEPLNSDSDFELMAHELVVDAHTPDPVCNSSHFSQEKAEQPKIDDGVNAGVRGPVRESDEDGRSWTGKGQDVRHSGSLSSWPSVGVVEEHQFEVERSQSPSPGVEETKSPRRRTAGGRAVSPLEILSIPKLQHIDGKFLGPSLFDFGDQLEQSDEEEQSIGSL
ncbi:hypothetical protein CC1G_10066 [Coprinopsis cinerea okayama7|uniref:Uncharacterized protein n=1 Tax=Coprinopsis cinerea (strain Okayama-7 / 130 / ATCC MYA-4618 / FGSC 9003) TaxID=240176 RepID=A8NUZ8_COPC7|nr:hypothetical protein CC1G_10066 [Coprinopsis cinerea okayama7\|eukprot:XP_001836572.1 hypothetical protein CC1G_10066 [Coprinopsis cinerea okayama7\